MGSFYKESMSKAFIKETDDDSDDFEMPAMPAGTKNYITPTGAKRLKDELHHLLNVERPRLTEVVAWAAGNGDRSENADYTYGKKRLREIDRRIQFLTKRLEKAEIVDPTTINSDQVRFGATVTICDEEGDLKTYAIVGVDEINLERNHISWVSPLASALLRARVGDMVSFRSPKGMREVEIVKIHYPEIK